MLATGAGQRFSYEEYFRRWAETPEERHRRLVESKVASLEERVSEIEQIRQSVSEDEYDGLPEDRRRIGFCVQ